MKSIGHQATQSVRTRLTLLCLVFAIPFTAIIIYQITSGINANLDFTRSEIAGNAYQRPLERILQKVPQYSLNGIQGKEAEVAGLEQQINEAFDQLDSVQATKGELLQVNDQGFKNAGQDSVAPDRLRKKWDALKSDLHKAKPDDVQTESDGLVSDTQSLIAYIGNTSNIILDPELDSYFLGDFTLNKMPQTQVRLATIWQRSTRADLRKPNSALAQEFAVYTAMLEQDDVGGADGDIKTSLSQNGPKIHGVSPTLQQRIPEVVKDYDRANAALLTAMKQWLGGQGAPQSNLADLSQQARESSFKAWWVAVDEFDVLLERRIDDLTKQRLLYIGLTFVALAFSSLVAWRIGKNITDALSEISIKLDKSSHQVTDVARQVAQSSQSLAGGATEQAAAIEQTSASLEEMSSLSALNQEKSQEAQKQTMAAHESVEKGTEEMRSMEKLVAEVKVASREMSVSMTAIRQSNNQIQKIIKTIDEIAFQTNILALNAAVEAARAGQAGLGFAVVAEEVRNLAQRSAQAARETSDMIVDSINKSEQGVVVTQNVVTHLNNLNDGVVKLGQRFMEIKTKVKEVAQFNSEIAEASTEQSTGIHQVNQAVANMDQVTQTNAAVAEQIASTALDLDHRSEELCQVVQSLLHLISGRHAGALALAR